MHHEVGPGGTKVDRYFRPNAKRPSMVVPTVVQRQACVGVNWGHIRIMLGVFIINIFFKKNLLFGGTASYAVDKLPGMLQHAWRTRAATLPDMPSWYLDVMVLRRLG